MKVTVKFVTGETKILSKAIVSFEDRYIRAYTVRDTELIIPFDNLLWFDMDFETPEEEK